eukprot:CAMPEP_0114627482 /NCGR_PEP_ID=MMETSP0168-20121206/12322_1 /TAXON_ID=95228 ORGANISM="Vannella sp., Strain DIVA3 517/6/12" /NCGR_SAMPLE_ID=MMETSP0168 /ASSEMBLY_ACC=CAM_ASM_000044 /LENGTH=577 /DNA_ID=CAMNT_0001838823 /DNA_START=20 /DNA_END=1750 /DNA_ORIENTATION=+
MSLRSSSSNVVNLLRSSVDRQAAVLPVEKKLNDIGRRTHVTTADSLRSWSDIAMENKDCVVKILSASVVFDWQRPFRQAEDRSSIGSGFLVSSTGLIVTNAHVVDTAARVWFTIPSKGETRFNAEVLGVCFDLDLALLQCTSEQLLPFPKFLKLGSSDNTQFGEEIITLGYPLGMNSLKLTVGIISGRQDNMFQTDAPLNPGNSGGPMLNREGNVIGINVAIVEQSQNVGFAIPVHNLKQIFHDLKSRPRDQKVLHKPVLGVDFCNSSEALHRYLGTDSIENDKESEIPLAEGIFISKTYEGFPLYNAGVRTGDILHSFDGHSLDNYGQAQVPYSQYARVDLATLMSDMTYESEPEIVYSRKGELKRAKVTFKDPERQDMPILPTVRYNYYPYEEVEYEVIAGLVVMPLCMNHLEEQAIMAGSAAAVSTLLPIASNLSKQLKWRLIVTSVFAGSLLDKMATFSPGLILESVNDKPVSTIEEFNDAILQPLKGPDGSDFIVFRTTTKEVAVLDVKECLREEPELSSTHMYDMSPSVMKLAEKYGMAEEIEAAYGSADVNPLSDAIQQLILNGDISIDG